MRRNVEFDHARVVSFSPDCRAVLCALSASPILEVHRIGRSVKVRCRVAGPAGRRRLLIPSVARLTPPPPPSRLRDRGQAQDGTMQPATDSGHGTIRFPLAHAPTTEIVAVGVAPNGRYIFSTSGDAVLLLWDLSGNVLHRNNTEMLQLYCASVSSCSKYVARWWRSPGTPAGRLNVPVRSRDPVPRRRFVACAGFTPDARLYEIAFDQTGAFRRCTLALSLAGHQASVTGVSFSADSRRCATISKDGTWRVWNIDGTGPRVSASVVADARTDGCRGALVGRSSI